MKICSGICSQTSPVSRSEQFSESETQGNLWALKLRDNVHLQISEHTFKVKWCLLCILSFNLYFLTREVLEIEKYRLLIPKFQREHVQSRDAFRPNCVPVKIFDGWSINIVKGSIQSSLLSSYSASFLLSASSLASRSALSAASWLCKWVI